MNHIPLLTFLVHFLRLSLAFPASMQKANWMGACLSIEVKSLPSFWLDKWAHDHTQEPAGLDLVRGNKGVQMGG